MTLPDDPGRWERGDWAFDAEKDAAWEKPDILCRRIGTAEELAAVADAIVLGYEILCTNPEGNERMIVGKVGPKWDQSHGLGEAVVVENLKALIVAVQAHPAVRLAKVETEVGGENKDGFLRVLRRWVEDREGKELSEGTDYTKLHLWHSVVTAACGQGEDYGGLDIGVTLRPEARFAGVAQFRGAHFVGEAQFRGVRFAGEAQFRGARFAGEAGFERARFAGEADFWGARVRRKARLLFVGASFAQHVWFDGDPENTRPLIRGKVFFTDSTLDERLTFDNTRFGKHARLRFRRFLARGGATIELTKEQLRLTNPVPPDHPLQRAALWVRDWFAFDPSWTIMMGGDGDIGDGKTAKTPAKAMDLAADDYELLAANYARQPATDHEEDGCRWMAHELRRRAGWLRTESALREFLRALFNKSIDGDTDATATNRLLAGRPEGPLLWYLEYFVLIWSCVLAYTAFAGGIARDWVWKWGIQRTLVGYLLQMQRVVVTGAALVLVCAMIYGAFASEHTITSGGTASEIPPWEADGLLERARFGLYFSLTTFVTLGYGDYAPTRWFKLVTGFEALLGVTLLALFTVAWGRKMVR